ncbi:hypothetical protein HDU67_008593 [Dinochytrium kinnereticum]|nr:hypothetical protein HDU67_008593 [Dinochytrium kinnereticum]
MLRYEKALSHGLDAVLAANERPIFPHNTDAKAETFFESMAKDGDPLADALVKEHGPGFYMSLENQKPYVLAEALGVADLPSWVDEETLLRGQRFFWKNTSLILQILLHLSLAGGFGVPRIDAVLISTGYLSDPKRSYQRLLETTQMITDAMLPGELTKIGGRGWLHVLKNTTLLSFQAAVLSGLSRFGVKITQQEAEDYTATWRFIGHLIGINDEMNCVQWGVDPSFYLVVSYMRLYNTAARAIQLEEKQTANLEVVEKRSQIQIQEAEAALKVACNLTNGILKTVSENSPYGMRFVYHVALARWLMGNKMSDKLGLPISKIWHRIRVYFHVIILRLVRSVYDIPFIGDRLLLRLPNLVKLFLAKEIARVSMKDSK